MYALHAKDGAMRWKHEPGDFESTLPYSVEVIYIYIYVPYYCGWECVYCMYVGIVVIRNCIMSIVHTVTEGAVMNG